MLVLLLSFVLGPSDGPTLCESAGSQCIADKASYQEPTRQGSCLVMQNSMSHGQNSLSAA